MKMENSQISNETSTLNLPIEERAKNDNLLSHHLSKLHESKSHNIFMEQDFKDLSSSTRQPGATNTVDISKETGSTVNLVGLSSERSKEKSTKRRKGQNQTLISNTKKVF